MIGNWDESNVIFGIFPSILEYVDNLSANDIFPIYNGPQSASSVSATLQGEMTYSNNLIINDVLDLSWLDSNYTREYSGSDTLTFEFWIRINSFNRESYMWTHRSSGGLPNFNIALKNGGYLQFFAGNGIGSLKLINTSLLSAYGHSVGDDIHISFVKNGINHTFYVNGIALSEDFNLGTWSENVSWIPEDNFNINQGLYGVAGGACNFHSIVLYNTAFTSADVITNYNLGFNYGGLAGYQSGTEMNIGVPASMSASSINVEVSTLSSTFSEGSGFILSASAIDIIFNIPSFEIQTEYIRSRTNKDSDIFDIRNVINTRKTSVLYDPKSGEKSSNNPWASW